MQALNVFAVLAQLLQDLSADARHNVHVHDDVRRVGQLHADLGDGRADRTHGERDHVQGATLHAALVKPGHCLLQFGGVDPVGRRAGVLLLLARDVGAVFHARNVGSVGAGEIASGALLRVQLGEHAGRDQRVAHRLVFFFRAIAPDHVLGLCELREILDPSDQFFMLGGQGSFLGGAFGGGLCAGGGTFNVFLAGHVLPHCLSILGFHIPRQATGITPAKVGDIVYPFANHTATK